MSSWESEGRHYHACFEEIRFGSRWCQELSADFKLDIHFKSHWTNCCRTDKETLTYSSYSDKETSSRFKFDATAPVGISDRALDETALIKVISDIIDAADGQQVTLLSLLDASAAFDTVNHIILLHRLETSYGMRGRALPGLTSFLTGRTQAVSYASRTSQKCRLSCGVVRSSDPYYSFSTRQTSSESPWDVEFESTYMLTTPGVLHCEQPPS